MGRPPELGPRALACTMHAYAGVNTRFYLYLYMWPNTSEL